MPWLRQKHDGSLLLDLHIQPGAKKSQVVGLYGERLKLAVAAPPVDGKANKAVVQFIVRCLGIRIRDAMVVSGMTSRRKTVEVGGVDEKRVRRMLTGSD